MDNREKVVANVTGIVSDMQEEVDEWKDYSDSELSHGLTCDCDWWYKTLQTLKDALALLKEQEPVKPYAEYSEHMGTKWLVCGACKQPMIKITPNAVYPNYCPECGRKVWWE